MGAYFRRRTLPWFLLAAVLAVVGLAVLHGTAEAVVFVAAVGVMLGAAIRYVGLAVRDDPVSASVLSRDGLIGGVTSGISSMSAGESAAKRRHTTTSPDRRQVPLGGAAPRRSFSVPRSWRPCSAPPAPKSVRHPL